MAKADNEDNPKKPTMAARWSHAWRQWVSAGELAACTVTKDPDSVRLAIRAGCVRSKYTLITWDCARGFVLDFGDFDLSQALSHLARQLAPDLKGKTEEIFLMPEFALKAVAMLNLPAVEKPGQPTRPYGIFLFHNFFTHFEDTRLIQEFSNGCMSNTYNNKWALRFIHFVQEPHEKLGLRGYTSIEHWLRYMPFSLPTAEEIHSFVLPDIVEMTKELARVLPGKAQPSRFDEPYLRGLSEAAVGLQRYEAEVVFRREVAMHSGLTDAVPMSVAKVAADQLASSGTMEVVPDEELVRPEYIGGAEAVIQALRRAAKTYTPAARAQHLDPARGLWFCGLGGTGKTTCATAASIIFAEETQSPWRIIRVKGGAFYGSLVGETEQNWYDFERCMEAFAKAIVFFDEFAEMFRGVDGNRGDGNVGQSLFGLWKAWMSNSTARANIYVIAAMNSPSGVPEQAFRRGRFDDGFFFDMPSAAIRTDIAKIHFTKRLRKMGKKLEDLGFTDAQWKQIGDATDKYLPSDIEYTVESSRHLAFSNTGIAVPTFGDIMGIIEQRRHEIEDNPVVKEAQQERMRYMEGLRGACTAQGARPTSINHGDRAAKRVGNVKKSKAMPLMTDDEEDE